MPDGQNLFPPNPPAPAQRLWPARSRPEVVTDQYRVMLADPEGNLVGMPAPVPFMRMQTTTRHQTRNF